MNSKSYLFLDDGTFWPGIPFGNCPPVITGTENSRLPPQNGGEVVFNTGPCGYQEILSDPSYRGQIVLMTSTHIGNYGVDPAWSQNGGHENISSSIQARGMIVRSLYRGGVPHGRLKLEDYLEMNGICGLHDVDTRALTLKIRREGNRNGMIVTLDIEDSTAIQAASDLVATLPPMLGLDLVKTAGVQTKTSFNPEGHPHIGLIDCGVKTRIISSLTDRGCRVSLLPAASGPEEVLATGCHALLISNGPGDPAPQNHLHSLSAALIGRLPLWGICMGHQIISQAIGARTYKMPFGHHGLNHPVRDTLTGRVFVTSQNHGFAVDAASLPSNARVRFVNTNDQTVEGIEIPEASLISVQHHPEAAPGPRDSEWIFDTFLATLGKKS